MFPKTLPIPKRVSKFIDSETPKSRFVPTVNQNYQERTEQKFRFNLIVESVSQFCKVYKTNGAPKFFERTESGVVLIDNQGNSIW